MSTSLTDILAPKANLSAEPSRSKSVSSDLRAIQEFHHDTFQDHLRAEHTTKPDPRPHDDHYDDHHRDTASHDHDEPHEDEDNQDKARDGDAKATHTPSETTATGKGLNTASTPESKLTGEPSLAPIGPQADTNVSTQAQHANSDVAPGQASAPSDKSSNVTSGAEAGSKALVAGASETQKTSAPEAKTDVTQLANMVGSSSPEGIGAVTSTAPGDEALAQGQMAGVLGTGTAAEGDGLIASKLANHAASPNAKAATQGASASRQNGGPAQPQTGAETTSTTNAQSDGNSGQSSSQGSGQNLFGSSAPQSTATPSGQTTQLPDPNKPQDASQNGKPGLEMGATAHGAKSAEAQARTQAARHDHHARLRAETLTQLAVKIAKRFEGQNTTFNIRLDPAELGRVNVQLRVNSAKKVELKMMAEKPETLSALNARAQELEATLKEMGFDFEDGGLTFEAPNPDTQREFARERFKSMNISVPVQELNMNILEPEQTGLMRVYGFELTARPPKELRI